MAFLVKIKAKLRKRLRWEALRGIWMSNLGFSTEISPGQSQLVEVGRGSFLGHGGLTMKIGPKSYRPKI